MQPPTFRLQRTASANEVKPGDVVFDNGTSWVVDSVTVDREHFAFACLPNGEHARQRRKVLRVRHGGSVTLLPPDCVPLIDMLYKLTGNSANSRIFLGEWELAIIDPTTERNN